MNHDATWMAEFCDRWDRRFKPLLERRRTDETWKPDYGDVTDALAMMVELHSREGGCTEEGCGCTGSMASGIVDAARRGTATMQPGAGSRSP